ncbi:MAG TPA: pyridoxamine 5'-phosphate oxidase family protein [Rhodococcus sp. (in: high G+C Gram-positive bacteria)]|jgi:pyridoxine/pyridoxamine 5'-phosphate oxidase|nr:pyridoxamine 5'-phosphate oxidase family protein [Rhodococcus sp. (in: high G+C Gram-positive bacteria)]
MVNDITMSTAAGSLTGKDLEFLRRPLHGFLTVSGGQHPQPRPVWFEATDEGDIEIFTAPDSLKVRRLQRDPWASIVVAAPVGERERWISVAGRATVVPEGAHELCSRLAARYWDIGDPARAADLAEILAAEQVRIVMRPEAVRRYAL